MRRTPAFRKPPTVGAGVVSGPTKTDAIAAGLGKRIALVSLNKTRGRRAPHGRDVHGCISNSCGALCLLASTAAFAEDPLPRAKPEDVGFSSERLARIGATLKADVDAGRIPGAVIAIDRHGKLVMFDAYGWRDKAANVAMTTDTIFNIASMTKPMTTVGGLMLYEQGKLLIDHPLSKYFPKFAQMRVAARDASGEPTADTVSANRQITIQDLMRQTQA
jgi:CubicO group peptidase (beta-lactamase class C family)